MSRGDPKHNSASRCCTITSPRAAACFLLLSQKCTHPVTTLRSLTHTESGWFSTSSCRCTFLAFQPKRNDATAAMRVPALSSMFSCCLPLSIANGPLTTRCPWTSTRLHLPQPSTLPNLDSLPTKGHPSMRILPRRRLHPRPAAPRPNLGQSPKCPKPDPRPTLPQPLDRQPSHKGPWRCEAIARPFHIEMWSAHTRPGCPCS